MDNVLDKNSVEAGIYIEWQTQIYFEFMREFVPKKFKSILKSKFIKLLKAYQKWVTNKKVCFLIRPLI